VNGDVGFANEMTGESGVVEVSIFCGMQLTAESAWAYSAVPGTTATM
jgi:hypothetical protein